MQNDAPTQPSGQPKELAKQYRAADHEPTVWQRWMTTKAFRADPARVVRGEAKPYCMLIPPPNVTAALHLGHALNNTLQDVLARAHRMKGYETLWMPGTDHAGIATQAVVEKRLRKEGRLKGALKSAFTREDFVAEIQKFKDEYEAVITGQLQAMGCSCDWDRQRFTMDSICARAVREAFFRLFKDGLIYRGKRLVNWDPALQTAVADDECYDEEIDGAFYYLRYPLVHVSAAGPKAEDPQPVTWNELARRGFPQADAHDPEEPAWITVATTRPETYLGDTAVALNPHDPRAKSLRGLFVELPLVGRIIPIVEDSYVVLPERYARTDEEKADPKAAMATGFLKVTPAHDPNDYEIGRRHEAVIEAAGNPVLINVMAPDGSISDSHGWPDSKGAHIFVGLKREDARKKVVQEFESRGLLEGKKPHRHSVKHSDRSKAIVEPYLSDQWYVKVTDPKMAQAANAALVPEQRDTASTAKSGASNGGSMRFHPARYAKSFEHWHDNIRDWCISRQLWWGHRIPVWTGGNVGEAFEAFFEVKKYGPTIEGPDGQKLRKLDIRDDLASVLAACNLVSSEGNDVLALCVAPDQPELEAYLEKLGFKQDTDVLDTWFSSGLWPLSTMGWPDTDLAAKESGIADFPLLLKAFNPTSSLSTAREIITLWVSRMTMFNRYFMGEGAGMGPAPFRDVFIHAVIQDGEGRKMSKSLGNGVDPLDIIATHGSDAMRFTLCQMATNTQDVRLPVRKDAATGRNTSEKFDAGRNFATKIWNATNFTFMILDRNAGKSEAPDWSTLSLPDRWMLSRIASAAAAIDESLASYEFSTYGQHLYDVIWRDFCDWYIESIKTTVDGNPAQRAVLRATLESLVRLAHPVMPYITEVLYEALASRPGSHAVPGVTLGPSRSGMLATASWPQFGANLRDPRIEEEFERMRTLVTAIREVRAKLNVPPKRRIVLHMPQRDLSGYESGRTIIESLAGLASISTDAPTGPSVPLNLGSASYQLSDLADAVDESAEKGRLDKQIADLTKSITTLEGRLGNPGYTDKAPPHMVQQTRDQLTKAQAELAAATTARSSLG